MLNLKLDHLGIIVKSIDKEIEIYKNLGYVVDSEIFQDDNQKMRGIFLKSQNSDNNRIELIEDLSESRSLAKILNSQCGKIYHMAFEVSDLEKKLDAILEKLNGKILSPIKEATYYKKVCFIFLSNAQIIELVEYR